MKLLEKKFIEIERSRLCYVQCGTGPSAWLAFHGFAQNKQDFARFTEPLYETHTFYSFDLFFHKDSYWHDGEKPLTVDRWKAFMVAFLDKEGIGNFNLTGFSLGGRFALLTLQLFASRVEKISLISPDGIKINPWYGLGSSKLLRPIFKTIMIKPAPFLKLNTLARKSRIISYQVAEFTRMQLEQRHRRRRVYLTWVVFKPINVGLQAIANEINRHKISLHFLLGDKDPVIHLGTITPLLKKVPHAKVTIIPAGHYNLMKLTDEQTLAQLYSV